MLGRDMMMEKRKKILDPRDQVKDKFKHISDGVRKGSVPSTVNFLKKDVIDLPTKSLNPKKPLPSVLSHHSASPTISELSTEPQQKSPGNKGLLQPKVSESKPTEHVEGRPGSLSPRLLKNQAKSSKEVKADAAVPSQPNERQDFPKSPKKSPVTLSKFKKLGDIESNTIPEEPQKVKKLVKKVSKNEAVKHGSKYFPAKFMADYCKQVGNTQFSLPLREYSELMYLKTQVEKRLKSNAAMLDATLKQFASDEPPPEGNKVKMKCFSQISQTLETNPNDGVVTDCYMNNRYLIIVQTNKINAYCKKDTPKEWILKDSMVRLRFENVVKGMIIPCVVNKKDTIVFCEVYLVKDRRTEKNYLKMSQYRFFSENGKVMKDFLLGSFDCELEKFKGVFMNRRTCTIAVSAWAKQQVRAIAWIFTHAILTDTMRCTPMIPVKHELISLHDISVASNKTLLLGFGAKSFTVWNGKTGERFIFVNLAKLGPVKKITCFYGVFAVILKGFLFLVVSVKDKLHMVAVNMGTGLFKSLYQFKLPKDHICLEAIVKDDKLIGITNKAIICWSLYNSFKLQQLKMEEGDTAHVMKNKLLITSPNQFKRILYMKSVDEIRNKRSNASGSYKDVNEDPDECSHEALINEQSAQENDQQT